MAKERTYSVWVIGQRISTETSVMAANALLARIKFAAHLGLKSYEVDAKWDRVTTAKARLEYTASR